MQQLGSALYRYVQRGAIKKYTLPGRKQGYFKLSEIEEVKRVEQAFFEKGILPGDEQIAQLPPEHHVEFSQARVDDMEEVEALAKQLFPNSTTLGADRRPLVAKEPLGNYIVRDNGTVVAYLQLQPLRQDTLDKFMHGEIRGSQLTADDIEPFVPGEPRSVLVKGMGAIGGERVPYYIRRLVLGAARDLGSHGAIISKLYATSDTATGIGMSLHAHMNAVRRLGGRFAFELDIQSAQDTPLVRVYRRALEEWRKEHSD